MVIVFFCLSMYSIARYDKQKWPEIWFFITLIWILLFVLITGSSFSPIFGFIVSFICLWVKKAKTETKPPLY